MIRFKLGHLGPAAELGTLTAPLPAQFNPVEQDARAILDAKCEDCHGAARTSDLDLRQLETILKGGQRGPAIVHGNAEASLLFQAVKREGNLKMPPGKAPLAPAAVPWKAESKTMDCAPWWSFSKPVRPPVPAVKNASRVKTPIDAFILAKLEENGLHPAAPADPRIRGHQATYRYLGRNFRLADVGGKTDLMDNSERAES